MAIGIHRYGLAVVSFVLTFGALAFAGTEPVCGIENPISESTPLCPAAGKLLPETYPAQSISISDDTEGYGFVEKMVEKVFRAQPNPAPVVLLNVSTENFNKLRAHLQTLPWVTPKMIANLRWVHSTGVNEYNETVDVTLNWQQDFYKGSFDPGTGQAVARILNAYPEIGRLTLTFPQDLKACGIPTGEPLPSASVSRFMKNGFSGGNIDMIPSGVCVLGSADLNDQEWETYSKGVCGDTERVKAPTAWLESFHTDEIFKVVPTSDQAPCDFALLFASPKQALDLMQAHADEPAFDFGSIPEEKFDDLQRQFPGMSTICGLLESDYFTKRSGYKMERPKPEKALEAEGMLDRGLRSSHLPGIMTGPGYNCPRLKNSDILRALTLDPSLTELNNAIQAQMTAFKSEVLSKLQKTLPQCRIKTLDVPDLFSGSILIRPDGKRIPAPGSESSGYSLFPNPANSDVIGHTIIMPEPYNAAIKADLSSRLSALGLKTEFIDTIKGFEALGNVHCETQILRYCRPR